MQKIALVTGGARGIGASVCKKLGECGYFVYVNCRKTSCDAEQLLTEIRNAGGDGAILEFDVKETEQIAKAVELMKHDRLDLLMNNAGVLRDNLVYQISDEDWNNIITTNAIGVFNVFEGFKSKLINSAQPTVISMGSISALYPRKGQAAYSASKAMVIEWTKQMAGFEVYKRINFYSISPGPVATDMIKQTVWYNEPEKLKSIPMGRYAEPEEVAQLVSFLSNNSGVFKNGSNIVFDGGGIQPVYNQKSKIR